MFGDPGVVRRDGRGMLPAADGRGYLHALARHGDGLALTGLPEFSPAGRNVAPACGAAAWCISNTRRRGPDALRPSLQSQAGLHTTRTKKNVLVLKRCPHHCSICHSMVALYAEATGTLM